MTGNSQRLLRLPQVQEKSGLSRAQIYRLIAAGRFPRQVKVGISGVRWVESEIEAWISERILERDDGEPYH